MQPASSKTGAEPRFCNFPVPRASALFIILISPITLVYKHPTSNKREMSHVTLLHAQFPLSLTSEPCYWKVREG